VEDLMSSSDPGHDCKESTHKLVRGSCGVPAFFSNKDVRLDMSNERKTNYINLLNAIETKFLQEDEPRYLDLVIGAHNKYGSFSEPSYTLAINPIATYTNTFESIQEKLKTYDTLKEKTDALHEYFPLSYSNVPNNKEVLDKLLDMQRKGIQVRLTNRMCGSCFPAFYYLVKHGVEYIVRPEQGLGTQNTSAIRSCFKTA
jgi:hypothetical protein